jgi:DNA polymerase-1
MEDPACPASLREMLGLMETVTKARTVYQTATECLAPDGRVHPFVSMRQASGRWSVTNPGLTVFGKRGGKHVERDIFIADDDDSVILSCDLSQVDMRAMAGHCQDPGYMALFGWGEDGRPLDPHTMIGEQVGLGREPAKAIGHGWNYGLGPARMIRNGLDPEKVYQFVNGMEARFPGLMAWREVIREMGKAGQILDNGFGRRMMCEPSRYYTVAPALMGQGGARDIMCESLLRLPRELWPFLRVMVHDEIVLSVPRWAAEEIGHILIDAMTWFWRGVPILCDLSKPGRSWGAVSAK